ncbi:MAG: nucleotidyltransferase family protein [Acidimicrobiales bacterium]
MDRRLSTSLLCPMLCLSPRPFSKASVESGRGYQHEAERSPTLALLRAHRREILELAARRGVSNVCVFGSVVRGDATPDSDIDLLVDFAPTHRGFDLFAFERELEKLLGHNVEVGTEIHPVIRDKVHSEAVAL